MLALPGTEPLDVHVSESLRAKSSAKGLDFSRTAKDLHFGVRRFGTGLIGDNLAISRMGVPRPQHNVTFGITRDQITKRLSIAVPEFFTPQAPSNGSSKKTSDYLAPGQVDNDDQVGSAPK